MHWQLERWGRGQIKLGNRDRQSLHQSFHCQINHQNQEAINQDWLEEFPGFLASVDVALMKEFRLRIFRVIFPCCCAQGSVELELNDVAHKVPENAKNMNSIHQNETLLLHAASYSCVLPWICFLCWMKAFLLNLPAYNIIGIGLHWVPDILDSWSNVMFGAWIEVLFASDARRLNTLHLWPEGIFKITLKFLYRLKLLHKRYLPSSIK